MTNNTNKANAKASTLAVDYAPEVQVARDLVRKAATAFKGWASRGDGTILPQCVEATRKAILSGYLADGRAKDDDKVPGSITGKTYAGIFGTTSSEVSFWRTLATAVEAGVTYGDDLWNMLALASGENMRLAKATSVAKVIREGGSVEAITKAVEQERAERDRRKAAGRKAQPEGRKATDTPEAPVIPETDDPVADALLLAQALDAAVKRIPNDADGRKAWGQVKRIMAETSRRETTLRKGAASVATLPQASGQ